MRDPVVAHGVAEGPHDVLLAEHFVETLGPIAAVEGLMVRHAGRLPAGFRPASRTAPGYPWRRARHVRWRPGPVQRQPVNRVRAGRQQLSADPAVCRRSPGRRPEMAGAPAPARCRGGRTVVPEGCESGRIGTPGERVWGNPPWVRIPLPPLSAGDPQPFAQWALCDQPERWRVSKRCRRGRGVSDGQCELEQRSGR